MGVLFVDIGKGTQDILIPTDEKFPENWVKSVFPSPTSKFAKLVKESTKDLLIDGKVMGGGPLKKALLEHLKKGFKVSLTKNFARTIRDDLQEVVRLGFEVVDRASSPDFYFQDLDFSVFEFLMKTALLGEKVELLGIACQDHGFVEGQRDRITRFSLFKRFLERTQDPFSFYFTSKTGIYSRFDSILEQIEEYGAKGFVVDSKVASICGVVHYAFQLEIKEFVLLDIGNGHTLGASVKNGMIEGFFEHHTKLLTPEKLKVLIEKLVSKTLTFEEVYEDGGHGALVLGKINPEKILITGPNRSLFKKYGDYAYPFGDVMMSGCAGLYLIYHKNLRI